MRERGFSLDECIARLDIGSKEMRDGKLYLAQQSGTVFGAVEFSVGGTIITGPDGRQFDLLNMQYSDQGDQEGLYSYLDRLSGISRDQSRSPKGQA